MMYDSGARVPVWCTGHNLLLKAYPDAIKTDLSGSISGFGTGSEQGNSNYGRSHFADDHFLIVISQIKPFTSKN